MFDFVWHCHSCRFWIAQPMSIFLVLVTHDMWHMRIHIYMEIVITWVSCDCHVTVIVNQQRHVKIVYIQVMYSRTIILTSLILYFSDCAHTGLGLDSDSKLKNGSVLCHFCSCTFQLGLWANYLESDIWGGGESKVLQVMWSHYWEALIVGTTGRKMGRNMWAKNNIRLSSWKMHYSLSKWLSDVAYSSSRNRVWVWGACAP